MAQDNPYDKMGTSYAIKSSTSIYNAYYERPAIKSLLNNLSGKRVLDAGCGSGTLTGYLLEMGAEVIGVDLSKSLLEIARKDHGDKVIFHEADLAKPMNFIKDASLDFIVSSLSLHYIEDWHILFCEFARILTKEGIIVFTTHHPSASRRWLDLSDYFKRKKCTEIWNVEGEEIPVSYYHRSLTEMIDAFRQNGFYIDDLLEPKPIQEALEIDARTYHQLSTREHFIGFRLFRKR